MMSLDVRHGGLGEKHVLGQRQHHGARAPGGRGVERVAHVLGDALDAVDLRHPFRHLAVHAPVVDLLEPPAARRARRSACRRPRPCTRRRLPAGKSRKRARRARRAGRRAARDSSRPGRRRPSSRPARPGHPQGSFRRDGFSNPSSFSRGKHFLQALHEKRGALHHARLL